MTRIKIKEAALKYFIEKGYDGATLDNIAKDVGIKKASIYFYFNSKKALFMEILQDQMRQYNTLCDELVESENMNNYELERKLYSIFKKHTEYFQKEHNLLEFLLQFIFFPNLELRKEINDNKMVCDVYDNFKDKIRKIILSCYDKSNINTGEINKILNSYMKICTYGILVNSDSYYYKYNDDIDQVWELYWTGIKSNFKGISKN